MLEQLFITFQILIIDVVMAADNAIIIGIIAANFAPDNRKKIIALGVAGAFIFRIFFATGANYIFEFPWVKILGGLLLIWVINNLRQDFFGQNKELRAVDEIRNEIDPNYAIFEDTFFYLSNIRNINRKKLKKRLFPNKV